MKKIILAIVPLTFATLNLSACDICGCSGSGLQQGLLPGIMHDFAGLRFQHRQFESTHPGLFGKPDVRSHEQFNTAEVWGRYSPIPRLQLLAFVPYNYFAKDEPGMPRQTVAGLGDIRLLANAVVLRTKDSTGTKSHLLLAGGGIKLPTGEFEHFPNAEATYNPNMQAGTGSTDYLLSMGYAGRWDKWGIIADLNYTINTANDRGYRFGNRTVAAVRIFGRFSSEKNKWTAIPQLGYSLESADTDYSDWDNNVMNRYSGGRFGFVSGGVDFFVGKVGLNLNASLPAHQDFGMGRIRSLGRFGAGITYLFNSF